MTEEELRAEHKRDSARAIQAVQVLGEMPCCLTVQSCEVKGLAPVVHSAQPTQQRLRERKNVEEGMHPGSKWRLPTMRKRTLHR